MTENWNRFTIMDKSITGINGYVIKFSLDGYVSYRDGESKKYICCWDNLPFAEWKENDTIDIDFEKTRKYSADTPFSFYENAMYKVSTSTSTALVRVRSDYSNLQIEKRNLDTEVSDLREKNARLDSRNDSLYAENSSLRGQIEWGKGQLTTAQNQLTTARNELTQKQTLIDGLNRQLTALQITINNKDNEIGEKKNEIKNLKGSLNISREEFLNQKIELKDEKLGDFIQQLGINRQRVNNLRGHYEALINARKNYSRTNIRTAENNIENIKQQLLNGGINVANTQKLCRKCEKITKLKLDLEQVLQQQYEARQEVPPRT